MNRLNDVHLGLRFFCDQVHMLSSLCVSFGNDHQSFQQTYGVSQEVELKEGRFVPCVRPLMPRSIYDLASLTKLFTAVLVLRLSERGQLDLQRPVCQLDSRFVHLKEVSLWEVLTFQAALRTPGRIDEAPDATSALQRLFQVERCELPAVRIYSDINAMVAACVMEAVTGRDYMTLLHEEILDPEGMRDTYSRVPPEQHFRLVSTCFEHRFTRGACRFRTDPPLGLPHDPKALKLTGREGRVYGHAGLFSTLDDMTRFCQALLKGRLLSRESLRLLGTNVTGRPNGDGTYRQYLSLLCFVRHPVQRLSEVPGWMSPLSFGLSGFTGNAIAVDPLNNAFTVLLGNRVHNRLSFTDVPFEDFIRRGECTIKEDGTGFFRLADGRRVSSSLRYVYFKDAQIHGRVYACLLEEGLLREKR